MLESQEFEVSNKIITGEALESIFDLMWEEMKKLKKKYHQEQIQNKALLPEYQTWTVERFSGKLQFSVEFKNKTTMKYDYYQSFLSVFRTQAQKISYISVYYTLDYNRKSPQQSTKFVTHHLTMHIFEDKLLINFRLDEDDQATMLPVYQKIKTMLEEAPERYDHIIIKKSSILAKIGYSKALVVSMVLFGLLTFVPVIRELYATMYIGYPIAVLLFSFLISSFFTGKVERLYESIVPKKTYVGYSRDRGTSIYKDDIDDYKSKSEILIGKNANNMKNRKEIQELEEQAKKSLPLELGVLLVLSIVVVGIGMIL